MVNMKKVSVVSIESLKIQGVKLKKHWESVPVKDNYYYVHIMFLLMGLMHFLPYSFFVTANAYWMHKFRNVSSDDIFDASKRTSLQSHFASGVSITNAIPNSVFAVLSTFVGYKIKARIRILVTLTIMTGCFTLSTLFVEVNTDSWQTLFFYMTFVILAGIISANACLQIGVFVIMAKFPPYFLKVYLFGQGCASVFNSLLQIATLSLGTSTTTSAFIYFTTGSCLMGLTLFQFYFSKYNKYYMYFIEHSEEDITRDILSFSQFVRVLKNLWPIIAILLFYDLGKSPQTPITALVVSENFGSGSAWTDVYFVPVVTYLFADICVLLGRVVCSTTKQPGPLLGSILTILRGIIFVPLLMLCNAQPRSHLPVLLPHDWEYILIHWGLSFTSGYIFNLAYLSIHKLSEPDKLEDSFSVFTSVICTMGALLSPLATLYVDLL